MPPSTPNTPTHTPHIPHPWGSGVAPGFFEIKFEITVFEKEVLRKAVSRFEKSVFDVNDFSHFSHKSHRVVVVTWGITVRTCV